MIKENRNFVFIVTLIVIGAVVTGSFWQNRTDVVQAQIGMPKLSFEIAGLNSNYVLFEPIPISFKLSNQTNTAILFAATLSLGQNITFLVRKEGGEEVRVGPLHDGGMAPRFIPMQPGKYYENQPLLENGNLEATFPNSGRYEVRVEFAYYKDPLGQEKEKILSNTIVLNITEPQGIDRQAYEYIKQTIKPAQSRHNVRELVELRQQFADNFRNSVYRKYMIVKLAGSYRVLQEYRKAERELCKIYNLCESIVEN